MVHDISRIDAILVENQTKQKSNIESTKFPYPIRMRSHIDLR